MKKGFTLIEMLGIITVLAVVLLVTFPVLNNSLKKMRENTTNNFTNNLKSSAETYIELNRKNFENLDKPGTEITFTIQDLYDANLLKGQIQNIDSSEKIKVIVGTDLILRYYYRGEQIGVEKEIDDSLSREIALIKETLTSSTPDGIYYYTEQGNLEDNANAIYLTRNWKKPYGNVLIHNHQFISGCIQMNNKNYDYYKGTITELTYSCSTIRGENLVVNGDLSYKNNTNFSILTYIPEEGTNGYLEYTTSTATYIPQDEYIAVDLTKNYQIGMTIRTTSTTTRAYAGFIAYDIDKEIINTYNVMYIENTLTTLARDLNNGDEYIYLTDMTNWNTTTNQTYQMGFIFWNYKDSTGYSYPELTYSRNAWIDLYEKNDIDIENSRIKLKTPWNNGYIKSGTKLSQCNSGGAYNFLIAGTLNEDWTEYNLGVSAAIQTGNNPMENFRQGTKYVRWMIAPNHSRESNVTVNFKNVYIREVIE